MGQNVFYKGEMGLRTALHHAGGSQLGGDLWI